MAPAWDGSVSRGVLRRADTDDPLPLADVLDV
jgi:hypothetical protein